MMLLESGCQFLSRLQRVRYTMAKIIRWTVSLGIILGLSTAVSGRVCPDKKVVTYSIYKMNTLTGRLVTETKSKVTTSFVCCEGYREIGRMLGGLQPKCNPICEPRCGNGTCYAPNRCSCELGYTHSAAGSCVVEDLTQNVADQSLHQFEKSLRKIPSKDIGQSNVPTGTTIASYTIPTYTTKQPNTTTTNFVKPTDQYVATTTRKIPSKNIDQSNVPTGTSIASFTIPTYSTKQPNTTTIHFVKPTHHYIATTTRRSVMKKCPRCDRGECVDSICVCALGYRKTQEGNCHPVCSQSCLNGRCIEPNRCECIEGYSYDSESLQCKPLCDGKIYGCIRGTCVGYNQCRCDNGTILQKDELFHCVDSDRVQPKSSFPWFLLLLLVPVVAVGASFCIVISRWKAAKAKRVQGQEESFSEVRFHNARNEHSSTEEYQKACSKEKYLMDNPSGSQGTIRRNGNVLIINT